MEGSDRLSCDLNLSVISIPGWFVNLLTATGPTIQESQPSSSVLLAGQFQPRLQIESYFRTGKQKWLLRHALSGLSAISHSTVTWNFGLLTIRIDVLPTETTCSSQYRMLSKASFMKMTGRLRARPPTGAT